VAARSSAEPLTASRIRPAQPIVNAPSRAPQSSELAFGLFCLYAFILIGRPQDYLLALIPLRLALVLTVFTVAVTLMDGIGAHRLLETRETKLYLLFYFAMIAGIPFSVYRPGSFQMLIEEYMVSVIFFVMFLVHVNSAPRLKRVAVVLVFAVFIFTFFGLRNGQFANGRYTTGSDMFDPNDVAFVELSLLAFAVWILVSSFSLLAKLMALFSLLFGILLVLYTASRGGLLGLVTFIVVFLVFRMPRAGKLFKIAMLAAILAGVALNYTKINIDRYLTLTSLEDDYNFEEGGRVDIWKRGWRMFLDRPVTGVGVGGFAKAIGDQRAEDHLRSAKWQTAHSTYVLALTETGLIGCIPFVLLLLRCLGTFNRLRRRAAFSDADLNGLPGFLLAGFCAQLVSGAFLTQTYSMQFTLAFAMSGVLNRMSAKAADNGVAAGIQVAGIPRPQPAVAVGARRSALPNGR
jgi:O-antigen ligase